MNNETQSLPYCLDMVATVKWQELVWNYFKPNFGLMRLLLLHFFVILLLFVTFHPELKENIPTLKCALHSSDSTIVLSM